MNSHQQKILYAAATIIALMLIFPPTYGSPFTPRNAYDFLFSLPNDAHVNVQLLFIQWFGVCLVAGILYLATAKKG
jgi:hypothetical protein